MDKPPYDDDYNTHTDDTLWSSVKLTIKPIRQNKTNIQQIPPLRESHPNKQTKVNKPVSIVPTDFTRLFTGKTTILESPNQPQTRHVGDTHRMNKAHSKRLRTGKIRIDGMIDLHGCTQDVAYQKVHTFITQSVANGHSTVQIITGKGSGVLQQGLPKWLNHPDLQPYILSITTAPRTQGGSGAYYIALNRKRT